MDAFASEEAGRVPQVKVAELYSNVQAGYAER